MSYTTKFRAFQLDSPGSLFSFFKRNTYTLIEARLPKGGIAALQHDLAFHNKEEVDVLHITSFDNDHCTYDDLVQIINHLRPQKIEIPSYVPTTKDGILCRNLILKYDDIHEKYVQNVEVYTKEFIRGLANGKSWDSNNIVYESAFDCPNKNDMSLIKLFRSNGFNVLSTGDCESEAISTGLLDRSFIQNEVDVLILSHHGADNGFTNTRMLDIIRPSIAICSSNNDNQFDHPHQNIRNLLSARNITLMTTKRGDVVIYQMEGMDYAVAVNMISDNEVVDSREGFYPKRNAQQTRVA